MLLRVVEDSVDDAGDNVVHPLSHSVALVAHRRIIEPGKAIGGLPASASIFTSTRFPLVDSAPILNEPVTGKQDVLLTSISSMRISSGHVTGSS